MISHKDIERLKRESDRVWERDGKALSGLAKEYFKERGKIMGEFVRRCKEEEIDDRLIIITLFTEVLEMIYALNEIDPSIKFTGHGNLVRLLRVPRVLRVVGIIGVERF